MKKLFWFHNASTDGCDFFSTEEGAVMPAEALYGPFKTFADAKRDALGYFRCDIRLAKERMEGIRAKRKNESSNSNVVPS